MTVEKVIENGMTYRVETEGATVVKMKVEPQLVYAPVAATMNSGDIVSIPMHLADFDGEERHDDLQVMFLVDGEQVPVPMTDGKLTLELELVTRGRHRISAVPLGLSMTPIELEVV
jgi:hypothetical protein